MAVNMTEIPDATQTPPPAVLVDGAMLQDIGKNSENVLMFGMVQVSYKCVLQYCASLVNVLYSM